jgi:A/G-specific adenine glycosylase
MNQETYFKKHLIHWHQTKNKRQLPWKEEKDVYKIWLSEIILQQTRAGQGEKYYKTFIENYPTVNDLASASLDEVYKLWEGLGYYNRCRNLHASARTIVLELDGKFPDSYDAILKLKGIGPYTAAAISSFGFNLPHAVVDGNVYRVLSRFFGIDLQIDSNEGKKVFQQLAQKCLDELRPAQYNQAIMDFGATVCKPDNPLCNECPLKKNCVAFQTDAVSFFPVKKKKIKQKQRWFLFILLKYNGKIAVQKRTAKDIWANLYEFPNIEFASEKEWKHAIKNIRELHYPLLKRNAFKKAKLISYNAKQQLSHQTIHAKAVFLQLNSISEKTDQNFLWKTNRQVTDLSFPKIIRELLAENELKLFMSINKTVV